MKILYLRCLMLIFLAGISIKSYSQNTISGTVTDKLGAVIGVNVIVEGTATGTTTDLDGKYSVSATSGQTIRFSMIGYNSQSVKLTSQTIIDITLIEDSKQQKEDEETA